jgi:hypothetical protein
MNDTQRANLLKLAEYLLNLPWYYTHFNMGKFNNDVDIFPQCKTVACALGHSVYVDGLAPAVDKMPGIYDGSSLGGPVSWDRISAEVYGTCIYTRTWDYLFHPRWEINDNTPAGAAKRILKYLESGVPEDFSVQKIKEVSPIIQFFKRFQ